MARFDYYSAARQVAEYEKRRPKKYRNCGWRYLGLGYHRGARYGRLLPETGYVYFTTQAWAVLQKCWKGYKIAKGQNDIKGMRWYAMGIRKAQRELGLKVDNFPNLGLKPIDEDGYGNGEEAPYESLAQRRWRERMEYFYY